MISNLYHTETATVVKALVPLQWLEVVTKINLRGIQAYYANIQSRYRITLQGLYSDMNHIKGNVESSR